MPHSPDPEKRYDVFLCHNRHDKQLVKDVADTLQLEAGLLFFLDEYSIPPSVEFMRFIEKELRASETCAIFLGAAGWGPTQMEEARLALSMNRDRPDFRIIPVQLPGLDGGAWSALFGSDPPFNWISFEDPTSTSARGRLIEAVKGDMHTVAAGPEDVTPYFLRRQAALWERSGRRDGSYLLRGALLRKAQSLATGNPAFVTVNAVPAFLDHCARAGLRRLWTIVVGAIATAAIALSLAYVAARQRDRARIEADISLSRSLAASASRSIGADRADERAVLLARQAYLFDRKHGTPSSAIIEASLREVLATPHLSTVYRPASKLDNVTISPNGRYLLVKERNWKLVGPKPLEAQGNQGQEQDLGEVNDAVFVPGTNPRLAVLTKDGAVEIRTLKAPRLAVWKSNPLGKEAGRIAVSPGGELAAVVSGASTVMLIELRDAGAERQRWRLPATIDRVEVGASPLLVVAQASQSAELFVLAPGLRQPLGHYPDANSFALLRGKEELIVGERTGKVVLWKPKARGAPVKILGKPFDGSIDLVSPGPDGDIVATASSALSPGIHFWSTRNPGPAGEETIPGVRGTFGLQLTDDGLYVVSTDSRGEIRYWRRRPLPIAWSTDVRNYQSTPYPMPRLHALARAPSADEFVLGGDHAVLQLWSGILLDRPPLVLAEARAKLLPQAPERLRALLGTSHNLSAAFSANGTRFATADVYGSAVVWNTKTPEVGPRFVPAPDEPRPAFGIALSPSGRRLAVGADSRSTFLYELADDGGINGRKDLSQDGTISVRAMLFVDEDTLLVGDDGGRLVLWRLGDQPRPTILVDAGEAVYGLRLLPDNKVAMIRGQAVEIGELVGPSWTSRVISSGLGYTTSLAVSDDGGQLGVGYADGGIRIWRLPDGGSPTLLSGSIQGYVRGLAFDRAGSAIMSVGDDGKLRSTLIGAGRLAAIACSAVWRDLTPDESREFFAPLEPVLPSCP